MTTSSLADKPWRSLSSQEKRDRKLVVTLLDRVRSGEDFSSVIGDLGISMDIVLKHAQPYFEVMVR